MSLSLIGLIDILSVDKSDLETVVAYEKAAQQRAADFSLLSKSKSKRSVASIDPIKNIISKERNLTAGAINSELKALAFNCGMSAGSVDSKSDASYVQIMGQHCANLKSFEVKNNTNGYTATVFENLIKGFETDLIQLNAGKNEIEVRMETQSGQIVSKFIYLHYEKIKNN